jgi:hypothetical protein
VNIVHIDWVINSHFALPVSFLLHVHRIEHLFTLNLERKVYMQTANDSSSQQDSGSPIGFYLFIGVLCFFAIGLVLYVLYGS